MELTFNRRPRLFHPFHAMVLSGETDVKSGKKLPYVNTLSHQQAPSNIQKSSYKMQYLHFVTAHLLLII